MSSNIGTNVYWWGKFDTRTRAYYSQKSVKSPNSIFYYDSIGSFLLGNIIKKLTGKDFLEYLKEKVLLELGFSKESYVLTEPGGYAVGDSAVMCTLRDFLIFARLVAKGGNVGGKQYIDKDFVKAAVSVQAINDLYADFRSYSMQGYGYLIWIIDGGFCFSGAGDNFVFYNAEKDFTFAILSDNQGTTHPQHLIYHIYSKDILPRIEDKPLPENASDYNELTQYENSRVLISQYGEKDSPLKDRINGVRYKAVIDNPLNITEFTYTFEGDGGKFSFVKDGKENAVEFSFNKNKITEFSFGSRPKPDMMGVNVEGKYTCAVSAGFVREDILAIKLQVIDTYFGKLQISAHFNDNEANIFVQKHGQYVFDGIEGYILAKADKGENI
jgi:hypothetical protein